MAYEMNPDVISAKQITRVFTGHCSSDTKIGRMDAQILSRFSGIDLFQLGMYVEFQGVNTIEIPLGFVPSSQ